jgi:N-acetylmuramoyl-L-alanine amidase
MRPLLTIPALVLSGVALQAGSLQVTAIRAFTFPGITRVAVEVNGEFTYRSDRAHNPERLFFDLKAVPAIEGHKFLRKEVGDKLVQRVRVAEMQPGLTRIVLDLATDVDFTASQLSSPDRLIIEVRPAGTPPEPAPPEQITHTTAPPSTPQRNPQVTAPAPLQVKEVAADIPKRESKPVPAAIAPENSKPTERGIEEAKQQPPGPPPVAPEPKATAAQLGNNASLTRALGLKVNRIVIDAGHGGHDQGTSGRGGLLEKDVVLDIALRLGKLIEDRMGAEVVYTRSDDTFIPLEERTAIANRSHADLFLSIHGNSSPAPQVAGVETYYLNFTNSAEAMNVAARENAVSDKSVFELKDLIQKISLHDKAEESRQFAASIQSSLQAFTAKWYPEARDRGVRKAPFVVLIGASMPSVLAEIGFLTNSRQEKLLAKPDYRQRVAEALYRGVHNYTQSLSHFDVAKQTAETHAPGVAQ